jgi:glycosyltransferase involved in cell wall biosynthesis
LDQKTNFDFDVIVGDDASTDGTTDIVREFSIRYPGRVKAVIHSINVGPAQNYFSVHNLATGDYIAHVDGDDYCLPMKLQIQADLLDSDAKCNMVFHRMMVENPNGEITSLVESDADSLDGIYFDRGTIIQFMSIASHSSKMYRRAVRDFEIVSFDMPDYYVNVEQIGSGSARIISDGYYGVYRSGIGISSNGTNTRIMYRDCFLHFHKKYPEFRLQVNTAALTYCIMDIKNRRKTWPIFFKVWVKTFHAGSVVNLIRSLRLIRKLRLTN